MPRKAELVAVLETEAQIVGYTDTVVLDASASYDPDNVQVNTFRKFRQCMTRVQPICSYMAPFPVWTPVSLLRSPF